MAKDFTTLFRVNQPHFPHQLSRPIGPEPFQYMAGVDGFEPSECRSQSPVPYRLAIPQYILDTHICPIKSWVLFSK